MKFIKELWSVDQVNWEMDQYNREKEQELRDRFAGLAMNGLLSGRPMFSTKELVEMSYELADAMLKARKESK